MKNLATCKPSEFIAQTAKIREAVANWLEAIDFQKIRNKRPVYELLPQNATAEQKAEIKKHNEELLRKQTTNNLNEILDNMLAKHPQETLKILALCCFVEPDDVDNHPVDEYLSCFMDMAENETVLRFFLLLARLDQTPTSIASTT